MIAQAQVQRDRWDSVLREIRSTRNGRWLALWCSHHQFELLGVFGISRGSIRLSTRNKSTGYTYVAEGNISNDRTWSAQWVEKRNETKWEGSSRRAVLYSSRCSNWSIISLIIVNRFLWQTGWEMCRRCVWNNPLRFCINRHMLLFSPGSIDTSVWKLVFRHLLRSVLFPR